MWSTPALKSGEAGAPLMPGGGGPREPQAGPGAGTGGQDEVLRLQLPACWATARREHTHQEEAAQEVDAVRVQPAGGRS